MNGRRQPPRLIPVENYATSTPPTTADLRAAAARMHANEDEILAELHNNPSRVAARDQMRAAEAEIVPRLQQAADALGLVTVVEAPLDSSAIRLAVITATLRGVEARCPHVPWPPTPTSPRTAVSLTSRTATCGRPTCLTAAAARVHDDGHCELCERESKTFTLHVMPFGPCVVSIELCDDCTQLFDPNTSRTQ